MLNIDNDRISVCTCFANEEWDKGRKKLFVMYNTKLKKLNNIEDIRFIIYNLAWVEYYLKNIEGARKYINEIKDFFESNDNIIKSYPSEYCKILDIYNLSHKGILINEDKIRLYEKTFKIYTKTNSPERYISLHNIYMLKRQYDNVVDNLNNILCNLGEYKTFVSDILGDLKNENLDCYNKGLKIYESYKTEQYSSI